MNPPSILLKTVAITLAVAGAAAPSVKPQARSKHAAKPTARKAAHTQPAQATARFPALRFFALRGGGFGSPGASPTQEEQRLLPAIHAAGLAGDRIHVPDIAASLRTLSSPFYYKEPLLALARLGAAEALPAVDAVIRDDKSRDTTNYAVAARARLVAEDAVSALPDGAARAAAKVARFYKELGLTPADLSRAEAQFQPRRAQSLPAPVGVCAAEQLADMVYQGAYADYASLPGVSQVDFSPDYGAALKMRLASLSQPQRIDTMIRELLSKRVWGPLDNLELQLLIDEGTAASQAVANQLTAMQASRQNYASSQFARMFSVLSGIGDTSQTPLVEQFRHDSDPELARGAEVAYYHVSQGVPVQAVIGY